MKMFLFALSLSLSSAFALTTNEKMPELGTKLKNIDNKMVTLGEIAKGKKGVLVVFTCNACPFAKAWWGRMEKIGNEYAKKGIAVVAINSNDPKVSPEDDFPQMKEKAKGLEYPYVMDETSKVAKAFGASKTPEVYLFNSKLQLVYQGAIDSDSHDETKAEPYLKKTLDTLLAGKPIAVAENKALGCGIKFRSSN